MNGTLNRAFATKWHLRRGRKMDNLEKELAGKMKLLKLTKERTADLVEKGNVVAIERQREALISITGSIETEKLEHIEMKFERGDVTVTAWSKEIETKSKPGDRKPTLVFSQVKSQRRDQGERNGNPSSKMCLL